MKSKYKILFQIGDKKLQISVYADNELEARHELFKKIKIDVVKKVSVTADEVFKDLMDMLNKK